MDKQRVLIASILSAIVVLIWLFFFAPKPPPAPMGPPLPPIELPESTPPAELAPELESQSGLEATTASTPVEGVVGRELRIHTDVHEVVLSSAGGVPRSWILSKFRTTAKKLGDPTEAIQMIARGDADIARRPLSVFTGDAEFDRRLASAVYSIEVEDVEESQRNATELVLRAGERRSILLRWSDGAGTSVEKRLVFEGSSYAVSVEVRATLPRRLAFVFLGSALGDSADPGRIDAYAGRVAIAQSGEVTRPSFPGRQAAVDELLVRFGDQWPPAERAWLAAVEDAGQVERARNVEWAALEENYFAAIAFADAPFEEVLVLPALRPKDATPRMTAALTVPPAGRSFSLFMGPKEHALLGSVRPDLVRVIDLGWFEFLAKGMFWCLAWIHSWSGNWGVAIVLLTLVIKVGFFPLTMKQLHTMQKMAKLQPQIKAINDRFARKGGDAKTRMEQNRQKQQEVMAVYQREGVNPMGGCLPMLVQLPFLYGFYAVLSTAFELRQAPFALWIQDLSVKDPLYVTPILMMISMIVQQAITPTTMDAAQRRIMYLMPLMMTWIFKDLASGLVLYWLTNNVLSIIQQAGLNRLTRKREAEEKESLRSARKRSQIKEAEAE